AYFQCGGAGDSQTDTVAQSTSCSRSISSCIDVPRSQGGEHERCSHSEEDFYYSEINQWDEPRRQSPPSPPPPSPNCSALSRSAPSPCSSLWQVQSEHSYQEPVSRVRSVSVGEQWLQHHSAPCRRIRSEAKKCRKVYGIEHRELWCTPCRWKKACQRFLD
ncbi:hypothetical protein GOODEAATRI_017686, partial [Goodea atripinnis]